MTNKFLIEQYWTTPYNLAIVCCVHWEETLWLKVIEKLKKSKINNISYIIANNKAYKKKKRYIEFDLNRCFIDDPSWKWNWTYENLLSYELNNELKKFNYIIDLHSTNFNILPYFIIDNLNKKKLKTILWSSIINNIYFIKLLKWTLISKYNNAISIEIWNNNSIKNINLLFNIIIEIIKNLNKKNNFYKNKIIFTRIWTLYHSEIKLKKWLKDFSLIKKWEIIWYKNNWQKIYADKNQYLLWLNNNILSHKLKRIQTFI